MKVLAVLLVLAAVAAAWVWLTPGRAPPPAEGFPVAALLAAPGEGFAPPEGPWSLRLPEDHAAHPELRSEAWYLTGNLTGTDGRRFGFQTAFFRLALAPNPAARPSDWAAHQVYRAHFAVTDAAAGRFQAFERLSRAALGLAGSRAEPPGVWLENWSLAAAGDGLRVSARADGVFLALDLTPAKPAVGDGAAGAAPGPARGLRVFVMSRLAAAGTLALGGDPIPVTGTAWLDRAWGEIPLGQGQLALDRMSLHLADARELGCLHLHRRGGGGTPVVRCTLIGPGGEARALDPREVTLGAEGTAWRSPRDGSRWPLRWRVRVPAEGLDLLLEPLVEDQELPFAPRAWSGAVRVEGGAGGAGHLELTGYEQARAGD